MAGTKIFKSDCYINRTGLTFLQVSQIVFKLTWDFFKQLEVAGYTTEIARNNGNSASFSPKPLGTDFYDGTSPFGENAWAVFRVNSNGGRTFPYYVFFQWSSANNFGSSPGSPALFLGGAGSTNNLKLGFQMAWGIDGGLPASPWGGTTGSLGSDTKGTPVWINPGAGSGFVYPRSNNTGNTHAASRQNTCGFLYTSSTGIIRMNFVADQDNWAIDVNTNNTYGENFIIGGGVYSTIPEITSITPFFMFSSTAVVDRTNTWGTTTGNSTTREGGNFVRSASGVSGLGFGWDSSLEREEFNNLKNETYTRNLISPLNLNYNGVHIGRADTSFWGMSYGTQAKDVLGDNKEKIVVNQGDSPVSNIVKLVIPWNGNISKGRSTSLSGVQYP